MYELRSHADPRCTESCHDMGAIVRLAEEHLKHLGLGFTVVDTVSGVEIDPVEDLGAPADAFR